MDSDGELVKLEDVEKEGDGDVGDEGSVGLRETGGEVKPTVSDTDGVPAT